MYKRVLKLVPFHNCWPTYNNQEEFYNDFVYTVWASPSNIASFKSYLSSVPIQAGSINAQLCITNSQTIKSQYQRSFPPECQGRPSHNAQGVNMSPSINHAFMKNQDLNWRVQALQRVMATHLPFNFDQFVAQELMVSVDQAQDFIFEYRRFMYLYGLTSYKLYPSEQVEKVWLIHMACGTNYIDFCDKTIKFVPYHVPFTGETNGYNDRQEYDNTLTFYQAVFNEAPCTSCWPPGDFRFQVENFQCMFINLIRLAGFYWSYQAGHMNSQVKTLDPRGKQGGQEYDERKEKLKEKKASKSNAAAIGVGAAVGVGAGVILVGGGLALVANPANVDYNDNNVIDTIADGFHDGLSALGEISFGDMIDVGEGALGVFEDIDWPDIDFDGFADVAGDLFGDAGEFFEGAGEAIGEAAGDVADAVGDVFDF